ncbi:Ca2+-binding RTX toxin-like protein [Rhizobium sp. SG_E_25_P2]|uniref:calcium-binding protein n=1 Tax=Rhizobium sp. SG_E_25_P2 TaxID=2879942 RepID=UPI002473A589|nr:M10 family metallopeptidase C-terminal domain-containing protein [Rhizobium sp. SG_E_25_P2]MDH6266505.1 Ca2+-binding RTX toxin-like protein [Rhizobium sp. SG_E_25_P2]
MAQKYNTIKGTNGQDILDGTSSADEIFGYGGQDSLEGRSGNDILRGGGGNDTLEGNAGNDILRGDAGEDVLSGGAGNDILYAGENRGSGNDELSGDAGADILYGSTTLGTSTLGNCVLDGGAGADTFYVLTKGTSVNAGSGNDLIYAGMGKPMKESYISGLDGGDGNDTISFVKAKSGVITELNYFTFYYEGRLIEPGGAAKGERYHTNIENAIGSKYKDELWGGEANNKLSGGAGNDFLDGLEGSDQLTGGAGADTFHFNTVFVSDTKNRDVVTDFSRKQGDTIDLHSMDANTELGGDQAFSFIDNAAFSGEGGEVRLAKDILYGDDDGDRVADFSIRVDVESLKASDFIL